MLIVSMEHARVKGTKVEIDRMRYLFTAKPLKLPGCLGLTSRKWAVTTKHSVWKIIIIVWSIMINE